jgi:cytochrome c
MVDRVIATQAAADMIKFLKRRHNQGLMFHQPVDCYDNRAANCHRPTDPRIGPCDVHPGDIDGEPFNTSKSQYVCWKRTQLIIEGPGGTFPPEGSEDKALLSVPGSARTPSGLNCRQPVTSKQRKGKHMKKQITTTLLSLLAVAALTVSAGAAHASEAIVKKARCVACHAVDAKRVGPAYKDVAAKYKGDAKAPGHLFDKVRHGGSGNWGNIPMIPHGEDKISNDDLHAAVKWILSLE